MPRGNRKPHPPQKFECVGCHQVVNGGVDLFLFAQTRGTSKRTATPAKRLSVCHSCARKPHKVLSNVESLMAEVINVLAAKPDSRQMVIGGL
jgi:hypothetical protein